MKKRNLKGGNSKRLGKIIAILIFMGIGLGYVVSVYNGGGKNITDISELRGGETGTPLSPALFTGRVAKVYKIAGNIPEVLDSLYCYCRCKENIGHKSLLSCYVGKHASDCDICLEEAVMADKMYNEGSDIITIRKAIDKEFSRF